MNTKPAIISAISSVIAQESVISIISSNEMAQKFWAYFAFISLGILLADNQGRGDDIHDGIDIKPLDGSKLDGVGKNRFDDYGF